MHLHFGIAVFERVGRARRLERQLPFLADRNKANAERVGDRRPEKKSARVDADDLVNRQGAAAFQENVDRFPKELRVDQDRRDVLEDDPVFRKIGDIADRPRANERSNQHPWSGG